MGRFFIWAILVAFLLFIIPGCTENTNDLYQKAEKLSNSGRYDDALVIYQKIIDAEPKNVDALRGRAYCQSNLGKYEESNIAYSRIVEIDPNDYYSLIHMAENFESLGKYGVAVIKYDAADTACLHRWKEGKISKEQYDSFSKETKEKMWKANDKNQAKSN